MSPGRRPRVLVLGGTGDGLRLAAALLNSGVDVETSLAGRTADPARPPGRLRIGGFGGAAGFRDHLVGAGVDAVVDATHPFAATMPWTAARVCSTVGIPRLRLLRPAWRRRPGDDWRRVADVAAAAATPPPGARVLVTLGRQQLGAFADRPDLRLVVRVVEVSDPFPLARAVVLRGRGPFGLAGELTTMTSFGIEWLVTRNSGGAEARPKLLAARRLGVSVVIIDRPVSPPGPRVASVGAAVAWVRGLGAEGAERGLSEAPPG